MTLGTDHGGEKFYTWPMFEGKDLSRGTNYQDAASIFAYECDQDFFGPTTTTPIAASWPMPITINCLARKLGPGVRAALAPCIRWI